MYFNLPIIDGAGRSVLLLSMEIFKLGNNTLINYTFQRTFLTDLY